ncbi:phosphoribosylamine--glycine ligase, partial [Candidatus Woesearchaeota archaeon]|nr:phosphoribosylamine--glycine ligase [Candidatus Woesearchaeota archaeon]
TQPILARMKSDIVPYLLASAEGTIGNMPQMEFYDKAACCVVMASGGYPGEYDKGHVISGLDVASSLDDVMVFHAGTAEKDGRVVSAGGRVLGVTALGETLDAAQKRAYRACAMIHWKGSFYRRDIGLCETEDNDC